jgi:hypothetical protein
MVQAILNTKPCVWPAEPIDKTTPYKWQTRRIVKPQPENPSRLIIENGMLKDVWRGPGLIWEAKTLGKPPYIEGDILYVRETWIKTGRINPKYLYRADYPDYSPFKPSIHMPREAARLFLKVKNVRVEQLQKITEKDAKAEGVFAISCLDLPELPMSLIEPGGMYGKGVVSFHSFKAAFYKTWDSLSAKRGHSWASNPWVWVIEFERIGE